MGRRWIRFWIFYRSQRIIFRVREIRVQIQFLLRRRWRSWILGVRYSYQRVFWFCRGKDQRFLFRWCSVLWRSCWRHLLFRRSIIRGGIIVCRFRFWLHRWRWVLSQGRQLWGRVFQLQFHWRKCWKHHLLLRWFCLRAFNHQVEFRVRGRKVPSRHYRLGYHIVRREFRYTLSFF